MTREEIEREIDEEVGNYVRTYHLRINHLCYLPAQTTIPADRFMSMEDSGSDLDD